MKCSKFCPFYYPVDRPCWSCALPQFKIEGEDKKREQIHEAAMAVLEEVD